MTIDVIGQIGATGREVSTREENGATARVLVATRSYRTSPEDLWDAITSAERIPRWFLPITGELRLGGRYQLEGNAGGEILECDPPRRLGLTWSMHGQVSWVNVQLTKEAKGGTFLRLEHIAHVPDDMWDRFGPGAVGVGWDGVLLGLDQHLTKGAAIRAENALAWQTSEEGKSFFRQSSDAWGSASIAAGTDPSLARAAAERTTAFYTGEATDPVQT